MTEFRMPSLGADMDAGTLVEWVKKPGDPVKKGDVIAVVETQKGAIEVEIFESGTLERLLIEPGVKVPVGTPMAVLRGIGEAAAPEATPARPSPAPSATLEPISPRVAAPPVAALAPKASGLRASPAARKLAAEHGLDLAAVPGTGPAGAVILEDVRAGDTGGGRAGGRRSPSGTDGAESSGGAPRLRRGGDAPGDRRRDVSLETRDPSLLPVA